MNNIIYIINEDGIREEAKILSKFKLSNDNDYIVYTLNEVNEDGMIKIYTTGISNDNGNYTYKEITTEEEWNNIKSVLKNLARSSEEAFPAELELGLNLVGEEISIRRPKKLLVSTKFADVIGSKYKEVKVEPVSIPEINIPEIEIPEVSIPEINVPVLEKEPELEKTIKIPTFEELQAINKNIDSVMETAKKEVVKKEEPVQEVEEPKRTMGDKAVYESRVQRVDYQSEFKKNVEPLLLDVYAKQQKQIEDLEEELSKTKFDLFEKQKEALSLSNEKEEFKKKTEALENQLTGVQKKMDGILSVLQDR